MRSRYLLAVPIVLVLVLTASLPSPAQQAPSKEKIDKLIEQLGSGSFEEREQATKELSAIGTPVLEALRKAAKNGDPEVRKRATELLPKIETQAESKRVLAPKRVHLVFKDTPVPDALAELQKKSGYAIHLHDPQGKLKERKITLDTGETSFWHAVALLCDKAELTEASLQDLIQAPQLPGALAPQLPKLVPPLPVVPPPPPAGEQGKAADDKATPIKKPAPDEKKPASNEKKPAADDKAPPAPPAKPVPVPPAPPPAPQPPNAAAQQRQQMQMQMQQIQQMQQMQMRMQMQMQAAMRGVNRALLLKDGKPQKMPSDDRSAVRVRTVGKSGPANDAPEGEFTLTLELALEPKLQWQIFESIRIEKAVDDRDKNLSQVIPQVPGVPGGGAPGGLALVQQQMAMRRLAQQREMRQRPFGPMGGNLSQQVFVQLKKGDKEAKSIKELNGSVMVQMLADPQPMIVADGLDKSAGKTFKGKEGGSIKIIEAKTEEGQTTIRLELEAPPPDKVTPENGVPGLGPVGLVMVFPARDGGKAQQPPAAAAPPGKGGVIGGGRVGGGGAAGRPPQSVGPMNGLCIQDDKGNLLPIRIEQVMQMNKALAPGGAWTLGYTLRCTHDKDKGQPAKVVYLGRKRASVEIPFALKDVPLP